MYLGLQIVKISPAFIIPYKNTPKNVESFSIFPSIFFHTKPSHFPSLDLNSQSFKVWMEMCLPLETPDIFLTSQQVISNPRFLKYRTYILQITNLLDLFITNYKLKEPFCYIKNLKDLSIINVKFKRLICNLKNAKDIYVTNVKLKKLIDIFCHNYNMMYIMP
jgi:hypothetical protein